jgi:hypothetical protein
MHFQEKVSERASETIGVGAGVGAGAGGAIQFSIKGFVIKLLK